MSISPSYSHISRTEDFNAKIPFIERRPRPRMASSVMSPARPLTVRLGGFGGPTSTIHRPLTGVGSSIRMVGYSGAAPTDDAHTMSVSRNSRTTVGTPGCHVYAKSQTYGGKSGYPLTLLHLRDEKAASNGYFGGTYGSGVNLPKNPNISLHGKGPASFDGFSVKSELTKRYRVHRPPKKGTTARKFTSPSHTGAVTTLPAEMVPTLARQIDEAWNRYMTTVEMRAPPAVATVSTYVDDDVSDDGYDSDDLLYGEHDYSDILGPAANTTVPSGTVVAPDGNVDPDPSATNGIDDIDGIDAPKSDATPTDPAEPDTALVPFEAPAPADTYTYHPHVDEDYRPHGHYDFNIDPSSKHGHDHNFPHLNDAQYMSKKTKDGRVIKRKSKSRKQDRIDFSKQENIRDVTVTEPPPVSGLDVSKIHADNVEKDSVSDLMRRMQIVQAKQEAREKHRQQLERRRDPLDVVKSFTDWVKR